MIVHVSILYNSGLNEQDKKSRNNQNLNNFLYLTLRVIYQR